MIFPIGTGTGIGKKGSKKGPESEILRNSPEFRPDFPTKSSKKTCLGYTLLHDMYLNQPNIISHDSKGNMDIAA
jgi:hypothetical protein